MCLPNSIQHIIHKRTGNGDTIAAFLVDTMQGQHTDAKFCHRLEAAKHLIKYGFPNAECEQIAVRAESAEGRAKAPSPSMGEGWDGGEISVPTEPIEPNTSSPSCTSMSAPVTHIDILNYNIAHLIRHETAEGHTVVNFLVDIMTGRDRPFTPKKFCIKPADRMAAARELLRRGFGDLGSRHRQSDTTDEANAYDTLHTDLAKRMREYSERGADTIRFLFEVMSDPNPEEEFTIHHRMSAAQELLRRGWDTNYDNIKPKHLQDYWRDEKSTRLSIGQKKIQAGLSTSIDDYNNYDDIDYEAIAKEIREEEDRDDNSKPLRFQATVPSSRHSSESRNLEDRQAASPATKLPLPQGEGWGEGSNESPSSSNSTPAQAKYRRIDVKPEKNIYDYGPNDPDPTIDYYFEPLTPEEQAKFDEEDRREHGLTEEEIAGYSSMPAPRGMSDPLVQLAEAAALHGTPILPNPLATKRKNPTIRSP